MAGNLCPHGGFFECNNIFCEYGQKLSEILHSCSNVIEKLAKGDTSDKIEIKVKRYDIQRLIDSINNLSRSLEDLIDLNHELALGICEHFDVLRRIQEGDFLAKASEDSPIEIVRMLGELINRQRDRFLDYINKIKQQHKEILELYTQEREILSNIGVAVMISEEDMTLEFVNEEFERLTGYSKKEVEGKMKWTEFFAEEMLKQMQQYHKLRRIHPSLAPRQYESKIKHRSGRKIDVLINVGMIPYTNKSVASLIDISERKKIQQQIIHYQKMESLGSLSGKIVHEFKNILSGIYGFSSILLSKIEDENLKVHVKRILEITERAKSLAEKILIFSRKEEAKEAQNVNLNKYLLNFSEFIKTFIGSEIILKLEIPEKEIFYKIEESHLEAILMNLFTNAKDAMPEGGEITLGLKEVCVDMEYSYTHPLVKPGKYVVLCLKDTGIGMDENTKERIFEPFFTTKPKGKGTGLGLSTVYGLIKNYEGHIHVYSELGKGTTFKIYLPKESRDCLPIDKQSLIGNETILVVDDDPHIRQYLISFLKGFGYKVYEGKDGKEAIEIYRKNRHEIDLCLIDLVMPGLGGIEVMRQIKNINPEAKIIIMSGHPLDLKDIVSVEKSCLPEEILLKIRTQFK